MTATYHGSKGRCPQPLLHGAQAALCRVLTLRPCVWISPRVRAESKLSHVPANQWADLRKNDLNDDRELSAFCMNHPNIGADAETGSFPDRRHQTGPVGIIAGWIGEHVVGAQIGIEITPEGVGVFGAEVGFDAAQGEIHDGEAAGGGVALLAVDADIAELAAVGSDEFF